MARPDTARYSVFWIGVLLLALDFSGASAANEDPAAAAWKECLRTIRSLAFEDHPIPRMVLAPNVGFVAGSRLDHPAVHQLETRAAIALLVNGDFEALPGLTGWLGARQIGVQRVGGNGLMRDGGASSHAFVYRTHLSIGWRVYPLSDGALEFATLFTSEEYPNYVVARVGYGAREYWYLVDATERQAPHANPRD